MKTVFMVMSFKDYYIEILLLEFNPLLVEDIWPRHGLSVEITCWTRILRLLARVQADMLEVEKPQSKISSRLTTHETTLNITVFGAVL